jgi:hypothetical protein
MKVTLVFVVVIVGLFFALKYWLSHPSDETLISNFNANKTEFENLIKMVQKDRGLKRVDDSWTSPDDPKTVGVSNDRIKLYCKMFAQLNIPRGFSAFNPNFIELIASSSGIVTDGSSTGYHYIEGEPRNVVKNLDDYDPGHLRSFTAVRHLQGNWHLYYDYDD